MKIPLKYYVEYWLKHSGLALATGFIITLLIPQLFEAMPFFGLYFCLAYQIVVYRHFWGRRKGDFEFYAKENLLQRRISLIVHHYLGKDDWIRFRIDRLNRMVASGWDIYNKMLEHTDEHNKELDYYINMLAVGLARKDGLVDKEQKYLRNALISSPDDLVGNFRLAVAYEKNNQPQESIKHYKAALDNSSIESPELKVFIENQITRIKCSGPANDPPVPSLRFVSW